jgi:ribosomal protein S27AE
MAKILRRRKPKCPRCNATGMVMFYQHGFGTHSGRNEWNCWTCGNYFMALAKDFDQPVYPEALKEIDWKLDISAQVSP